MSIGTHASGPANGIGLYQLVSGGTDPRACRHRFDARRNSKTSIAVGLQHFDLGLNANYNNSFPYLLALTSSY